MEKNQWIDAEYCLPQESGEYLVITRCGNYMVLNYSVRHKVFNAHDDSYSAENEIQVKYWMRLPKMPKDIGGKNE